MCRNIIFKETSTVYQGVDDLLSEHVLCRYADTGLAQDEWLSDDANLLNVEAPS